MIRDKLFNFYSQNADLLVYINFTINTVVALMALGAIWKLNKKAFCVSLPLIIYFYYSVVSDNLFFTDYLLFLIPVSIILLVYSFYLFSKLGAVLYAFMSLWFLTFTVYTANIGSTFFSLQETFTHLEVKNLKKELAKIDSATLLQRYSQLKGYLYFTGENKGLENYNLDIDVVGAINSTDNESVEVVYSGSLSQSELIAIKKFGESFYILKDEKNITLIMRSVYYLIAVEYLLCTLFWLGVFFIGYLSHKRVIR